MFEAWHAIKEQQLSQLLYRLGGFRQLNTTEDGLNSATYTSK